MSPQTPVAASTSTPNPLSPVARALLVASILSVPFTLVHAVEDFAYNVHEERFGVPLLPAALALSLAYAAQLLAAALSARNDTRGHWLNVTLGLFWFFAAALDHLGEVLFAWPYRNGLVSKLLEVGIMLAGLIWAALAWRAATRPARPR